MIVESNDCVSKVRGFSWVLYQLESEEIRKGPGRSVSGSNFAIVRGSTESFGVRKVWVVLTENLSVLFFCICLDNV